MGRTFPTMCDAEAATSREERHCFDRQSKRVAKFPPFQTTVAEVFVAEVDEGSKSTTAWLPIASHRNAVDQIW